MADRVAVELAKHGTKRIAVPGGSTPLKVFELLAASRFDWSGTEVWPTDDRQVQPDHPASNFGKLKAALRNSGAALVELREGDPAPRFDLVWLGMGADGHVASLFPRMAADELTGPRVIATVPEPLPPEAPFARLSLNFEALVATDEIILAITGAGKRRVLEGVLSGQDRHLPIARLLRTATSPVTIYWSE